MAETLTRQEYVNQPGKDIFGSEKVSDSSHLFECRNCGRKVAGNRFAQHIDRCLGGRQRK
jgi:SAGA-associated factor 11